MKHENKIDQKPINGYNHLLVALPAIDIALVELEKKYQKYWITFFTFHYRNRKLVANKRIRLLAGMIVYLEKARKKIKTNELGEINTFDISLETSLDFSLKSLENKISVLDGKLPMIEERYGSIKREQACNQIWILKEVVSILESAKGNNQPQKTN